MEMSKYKQYCREKRYCLVEAAYFMRLFPFVILTAPVRLPPRLPLAKVMGLAAFEEVAASAASVVTTSATCEVAISADFVVAASANCEVAISADFVVAASSAGDEAGQVGLSSSSDAPKEFFRLVSP